MLNSYDEIWQYTERRLPVCRLGDNKLFCFVERETPPHVNERVKWLISFVRIALIHFIVSRAPLIIPRSVFLTAFFGGLVHFWHRNIWLSRSLTVLMNSWNDFHKVACFPQVRATVKYAWLKNKWSRLLRKCWYSRGSIIQTCMIYKSVLFGSFKFDERGVEIQVRGDWLSQNARSCFCHSGHFSAHIWWVQAHIYYFDDTVWVGWRWQDVGSDLSVISCQDEL